MTKPLTPKQILVAKVAQEQNLDPKKLDRMTYEELKKMDIVVPDEGDLLGAPESPSTDGIPENGSDTRGSGSVDASGVGQTLPGSGHDDVQLGLPAAEGTLVIGETVPEAGADLAPSETPIPPTEMADEEGHDVSGEGADAVVKERIFLGYHPVTEAPIWSDEQ